MYFHRLGACYPLMLSTKIAFMEESIRGMYIDITIQFTFFANYLKFKKNVYLYIVYIMLLFLYNALLKDVATSHSLYYQIHVGLQLFL